MEKKGGKDCAGIDIALKTKSLDPRGAPYWA